MSFLKLYKMKKLDSLWNWQPILEIKISNTKVLDIEFSYFQYSV
jgi:hypothetical protein